MTDERKEFFDKWFAALWDTIRQDSFWGTDAKSKDENKAILEGLCREKYDAVDKSFSPDLALGIAFDGIEEDLIGVIGRDQAEGLMVDMGEVLRKVQRESTEVEPREKEAPPELPKFVTQDPREVFEEFFNDAFPLSLEKNIKVSRQKLHGALLESFNEVPEQSVEARLRYLPKVLIELSAKGEFDLPEPEDPKYAYSRSEIISFLEKRLKAAMGNFLQESYNHPEPTSDDNATLSGVEFIKKNRKYNNRGTQKTGGSDIEVEIPENFSKRI